MTGQILVYGDSLSWGIVPGTRKRLELEERWPGVMEGALTAASRRVRVIENCLNGRRTVWDDPFKPGRSGIEGLAQCIEMHSPLDLVIVMLGTNDFQSMHAFNAWHSAQGVAAVISTIRSAPIEPGMPIPPVLLLAPPVARVPKGSIAPKFEGARGKSEGLAEAYSEVAATMGCAFFDAASVTETSAVDGVHLDADQHRRLGVAVAARVASLLGS